MMSPGKSYTRIRFGYLCTSKICKSKRYKKNVSKYIRSKRP
jgi:hypothetical protein